MLTCVYVNSVSSLYQQRLFNSVSRNYVVFSQFFLYLQSLSCRRTCYFSWGLVFFFPQRHILRRTSLFTLTSALASSTANVVAVTSSSVDCSFFTIPLSTARAVYCVTGPYQLTSDSTFLSLRLISVRLHPYCQSFSGASALDSDPNRASKKRETRELRRRRRGEGRKE